VSIGVALGHQDSWGCGLTDKEVHNMALILEQVSALKLECMPGEAIIHTSFARSIQPSQARTHRMEQANIRVSEVRDQYTDH
jgi:hypothetical protein